MHLRSRGVRAFAPNVAPYNTIEVRSEMWADRLDRIQDTTGADAVVLIAHSMGGLDARYMISEMGLHDRISALVTIATPHRGSSIASFIVEQPEIVRTRIMDLANWLGTHALEGSTSDAYQAISQLTPDYTQNTFNPSVPDHPSVRYWSVAGRAGKGTDVPMDPFLSWLNHLLYQREGTNDGFVSVDSAQWGHYLGTVDADHGRQVGLDGRVRDSLIREEDGFDADAFYRSIAQMLADEGF
jgi:triacylglycerol lipase